MLFTSDRKQAAETLHVSIRTIDRYIQKGVIRKKIVNGKILVCDEDIKSLKVKRGFENEYDPQISQPSNLNSASQYSGANVYQAAPVLTPKPEIESMKYQLQDLELYKKFYEEMQIEVKEKRRQLEGANYRVGQLEGQLKESVPLIEYKKVVGERENTKESLEKRQEEVAQLEGKLSEERLNRKIFMIILIVLILLQPLWLLLPIS